MYVVTNRELLASKAGFETFGKRPNPKGPLELRIVRVEGGPGAWSVEVLDDTLSRAEKQEAGLPVSKRAFASQLVARRLQASVEASRKNILFFVHGYNNDMEDVVTRAHHLERRFGVEVVAFSWPANGGGTGAAEYLSDKRDAQVSAPALDRVFAKFKRYLFARWEQQAEEIRERAEERYPDNAEARNAMVAEMADRVCSLKVSLLAHSMGNYVLKKMLESSANVGMQGLFDNVVLVAADTNAHDHASWVGRIDCRGRVLVAINEDDFALGASRMKMGDQQLARLGHVTTGLDAERAVYVDFTDAPGVGSSHAYFEGKPVALDEAVAFRFFSSAFQGGRAEKVEGLAYRPRLNLFVVE